MAGASPRVAEAGKRWRKESVDVLERNHRKDANTRLLLCASQESSAKQELPR